MAARTQVTLKATYSDGRTTETSLTIVFDVGDQREERSHYLPLADAIKLRDQLNGAIAQAQAVDAAV